MSTLYLLTNMFPYGDVEPYLENEIEYYGKFDKVYIFALQIHEDQFSQLRDVGHNITVIPIKKASNITYLLNVIPSLFDLNLYKEIKRLIVSKRCSKGNIVKLFVYFSRAHYETRLIHQQMKKHVDENSVFYSYRFEYQPYVAVLLKERWNLNSKIVSRAHRYDLYENVTSGNYIPMREALLKKLAGVFPCSEDGSKYLISMFPQYREKIRTRYLGTRDFGICHGKHEIGLFHVVSCSNVVPVKRLDILVKALSLLKGMRVAWTHYGDGKLLDEIRSLANDMLCENVEFSFAGNLDNKSLMQEYKKNYYNVFVNVSSSEGLPVSIMEAMSFGIPCIATDVGGTSEIVNNDNGILLSENPTPEEVSKAIKTIARLECDEYEGKRKKARMDWENKFKCEKNYQEFTDELIRIMEN